MPRPRRDDGWLLELTDDTPEHESDADAIDYATAIVTREHVARPPNKHRPKAPPPRPKPPAPKITPPPSKAPPPAAKPLSAREEYRAVMLALKPVHKPNGYPVWPHDG